MDAGAETGPYAIVTGTSGTDARQVLAEQLFASHYPKLAGWVRRLVDDDDTAHEIASEAFVRLLSKWTSIDKLDSPQSYPYMIATNLVRDHWRKMERERRAFSKAAAGTDPEPHSFWLLWLDLWALSPRNPGVAAVRQKSDERWREAISSIVLAGQEAGEFAPVDADDFTITLSALLDGLAVQIALEDPHVPPQRSYDLAMRFAAGQLGFHYQPAPGRERRRGL